MRKATWALGTAGPPHAASGDTFLGCSHLSKCESPSLGARAGARGGGTNVNMGVRAMGAYDTTYMSAGTVLLNDTNHQCMFPGLASRIWNKTSVPTGFQRGATRGVIQIVILYVLLYALHIIIALVMHHHILSL